MTQQNIRLFPAGFFFAVSLILGNQAIADRLECSLTTPSGKPSAIRRATLSAREYVYPSTGEVGTEFRYAQFPAELNQNGENVLIETERLLTINNDMHHARKLLLKNKKYYDELFGFQAPIGTAEFDKLFVCKKPTLSDTENSFDGYYKAILSKLDAAKAKQLQETYALWIKSRDMTCSLETMFSGTSKNGDDFMETCLIRITENYSKTLRTIYATVNPATTD
jgi:uncharacterized protein YecT (DUF1311 family)